MNFLCVHKQLRALKLAVAIETEARRYNDQYGFKFAPCTPDELN